MTKEAGVDFDVGVDQLAALGEPLATGAVLCRVHARTQEQATGAVARISTAFEISNQPVAAPSRVVEVL